MWLVHIVLELRNRLVTTKNRNVGDLALVWIVDCRQSKIDQIILHRSLSTRISRFHFNPALFRPTGILWMEQVREKRKRVHHDIEVHTISGVK